MIPQRSQTNKHMVKNAGKTIVVRHLTLVICFSAVVIFPAASVAQNSADEEKPENGRRHSANGTLDKYVVKPVINTYHKIIPGFELKKSADPLEPMNRKLYAVNEKLDQYFVKPAIKTYNIATPVLVRMSVSNFFNNIGDFFSGVNDLLQAKFYKSSHDFGRVTINTTLGTLGLFDVASRVGLERGEEDFGQTLGYWGLGQGPYLFLPLLGPTTFRDGTGSIVRAYVEPIEEIHNPAFRNSVFALSVIDQRAQAEDALGFADTASLDRYRFIRNAYLQRRYYLTYDGQPPDTEE